MSGGYSSKKIISMDCRELEPPEPMVKVLEAVQVMKRNEALLMIHRKVPRILLPRLSELGLNFEVVEEEPDTVKLYIWREQ
jgi:TusA-related sulfurtransferase